MPRTAKPFYSKALRLLFALVFFAISNHVKGHTSYYVKQSATGLNNGSSWTNAFTSLTSAFSLLTTGDTIRVAKGMYTPGTNALNSFLLKDSVIIMGGYPDTGNPTDADRNFSDYPTIMSGEIGVPNNPLDNIKVILKAINAKGFVVDGFVIENGYSGGSTELGPIYFTGASGVIDHSVIRNNFNYWGGAAINAVNTTGIISNSFIENNTTELGNGDGSVFKFSSLSNIGMVNVVVAKNKTTYVLNLSYSTSSLLNSTFFKNYGFNSIHDTSGLVVRNSILYNNGNNFSVDTAEFYKDVYSFILISNTLTQVYNAAGPNFLGVDPKFTDTARVAGADGKYFSADDGLRLLNPCSPAINAGNTGFVAGVDFDIAGATRVKNVIVDLGAYEVQEAIGIAPSVIYVKKNATGLNNGTSWQDAFTDLQSAFARCSDTIKVAKGIYPVSAADQGASFVLNNHRVVMGGYPDSGSPTNNDINTELYPSKLDGMIGSSAKCYNIVLSNNNDSTARMIGFEIMNSASPDFNVGSNATFKITRKSSPYLEKIKMNSLTNQAKYLLYIAEQSKPKFYNCAFYNGYTSVGIYDGARTISIRNNSDAQFLSSYFGKDTTAGTFPNLGANLIFDNSTGTIDDCSFFMAANNAITNQASNTRIQNSAFTKGVGRSILNISSVSDISNCVFRDNTTTSGDGGSIAGTIGSVTLIDKCRFYTSTSSGFGGAVANQNSQTTLKNCLFRTCRANDGAALYNNAGTMKTINCVGYLNFYYGNSSIPKAQFLMSTGGSASSVINSTIISATMTTHPVIHTVNLSDTLKLYNSIIWRYGIDYPIANNENDVFTANNNNTAICDIRNSILFKQANTILTNSTAGINPRLIDLSNPEGPDNVFYSADDGLALCTCSPAINAGTNSFNPELVDILGANRVFNSTIDIGAYELQTNLTTDKIFFVKENASPGGNGVGWANAYNSLQKAILNNCADTIKISKGTYKPSISSRDSSFTIYRGVTILGGYPDAGNPTDQDRDLVINPTILSGDIGILNDSTDNTANILFIHCPDTTVSLDGLIIERGNADKIMPYPQNTGKTLHGGGIYSMSTRYLSINECILRNNYGQWGGGIYFLGTVLDINKSEFSNNNATDGGGFYGGNYYTPSGTTASGVPVSFRNSVFYSNKGRAGTNYESGGIAGMNNFLFENLIVYKNEGPVGAGFYFNSGTVGTIRNCIFAKNKNTTPNPGVAISLYNQFAQVNIFVRVQNTIFLGNNVMGATSGYTNIDFNWKNTNGNPTESIPFPALVWSAISPGQTGPVSSGLIGNAGVSLTDINNGPGPDNLWRTVDDGLRPTPCSNTINKGNNTYVTSPNLPLDILDSARIMNTTVDMGPYELNSSATTNPAAAITASDTTICTGTLVTFNATVPGSNVNTVYQWMVNSTNVGTNSATFVTNTLSNNDTVKVVITINNTCANAQIVTSNSIVIHVNATLTASVSISSSLNPSCQTTSVPITFTATPLNGGAGASYQWKKNAVNVGTNSATYTPASVNNNDIISVVMTSSLSCVTSNPVTSNSITQIVNPLISSSVTMTHTTVGCPGSPIIFTANPVNGGANPNYQWNVNGLGVGTNSPTFTSSALNENDDVVVVMISDAPCTIGTGVLSSHYIVHFTYTGTASVGITSTAVGCPGSSITFTANPVNGGTTPVYQWKVNGSNAGTNSPAFTSSILNENDVVTVVMTSNSPCVATTVVISPPVVVHYTTSITASVSVTSTAIGCPGSSITFTANPVNGGTTPSYQWKVNGANVGTNSPAFTSSTLIESDIVTVVMTSNASCVATTVVTSPPFVVHYTTSITASVAITSTAISCPGSSITFTANPVNGGATPSYQWKVNGVNVGTNSSTNTSSTLNENDVVTVVMTSNAPCVATTVVTSPPFVVHYTTSVTASVGITSTAIGCIGSPITFTANPINGGTAPSYQWKVNGINVGTNSPTYTSSTLNENDGVIVVMTSNSPCVAATVVISPPVVVHYATSVTASVGITSTAIGCIGSSITFTANPVNGGTAPSYQWKVNGINVGTNSSTFTSSTLNENDAVTVVMTSNSPCVITTVVTSPPVVVHYTISATASVGITSTAIGCPGSSITFTANPVNGGAAPSYQWKVNGANVGTNSSAFISSALNENDAITVVMTSNSPCVAITVVTSQPLVVHYSTASTPSVNITAGTTNICPGTPVTFIAVPVNGGTAPSYQWEVNGINASTNNTVFSTTALANNDQVKVIMSGTNSCGAAYTIGSNIIVMNVQQLAVPVIVLNGQVLSVSSPDAAAIYTWQVLNTSTSNWSNVVPTTTGIAYTVTSAGTYRVKAEKGSCIAYSVPQQAVVTSPTSIHIYLYPNPAHTYIRLDSIRLERKWKQVDIIDITGRLVLAPVNIANRITVTIDVTILPPGTYIAIIKQQDGVQVAKKFVKM